MAEDGKAGGPRFLSTAMSGNAVLKPLVTVGLDELRSA